MHRKFTKEGPFAPFSPREHLAQVQHARKTREWSPRVRRATQTSPVSQALVCVCAAVCEHSHSHEEPSCDRFPASRTPRLPLRMPGDHQSGPPRTLLFPECYMHRITQHACLWDWLFSTRHDPSCCTNEWLIPFHCYGFPWYRCTTVEPFNALKDPAMFR